MTGTTPPYSRGRIRVGMDQLAKSHAAADDAIAAFTRSVVHHRSADPRPTVSQRVAGSPGWPQTFWLSLTTLLTGLFMAWISVRLVQHLSVAPGIVAVLPGLLLTLALGGTSVQAAKSLENSWTWFTVAAAGSVAWITLSLATTTATPAWAALICAAAVVAGAASGMLVFSRSAVADAATGEGTTGTIPRRLRIQRSRAHDRLRDHISRWNSAAHRYSLVIDGSNEAAHALTRLIAGDADPSLDGIDPYNTLMLTVLCRCRPTPLMASLDVALQHLNEMWPQEAEIESGRAPSFTERSPR